MLRRLSLFDGLGSQTSNESVICLSDMNSPLFLHACHVGPEGHGAFKLAGVDKGEDQHGVYHHRHPEVLQDPSPPLEVHLEKSHCFHCV